MVYVLCVLNISFISFFSSYTSHHIILPPFSFSPLPSLLFSSPRDHMSLPTSITLSPDGYLLASAGRDKVRTCSLSTNYTHSFFFFHLFFFCIICFYNLSLFYCVYHHFFLFVFNIPFTYFSFSGFKFL